MHNLIFNSQCVMDPLPYPSLDLLSSPLINLLTCLGYNDSNLPLADLLTQYHKLEGEWVILNPVVWLATHNNAAITAYGSELGIDEKELISLFESLSQYLALDGLTLYYHDAYTWLLSTSKKSFLKAKSIHHIVQKPLFQELGELDDTLYWQQFLTDMQLFFAANHPTSSINGVWVWSTSLLGKKKTSSISTNKDYLSLAQLCSEQVSLYNPEKNLKEYNTLVLNNWSELSPCHQEQLKNITACWFWNNVTYKSVSASWFSRLWRKYIHAH